MVYAGTFNNRVNVSDITITKKSVDGGKSENAKSDLFAYTIEFDAGFDMTDYFVSTDFNGTNDDTATWKLPTAQNNVVTDASGKYIFYLHEDETFRVCNVPIGVTYTIVETQENNGWEFVDSTEWDDSQGKQVDGKGREVWGEITVERRLQADQDIDGTSYQAGDKHPNYKGQNDHIYRNRFTEVVLKKVAPPTVENESFPFEVTFKVTTEMAANGFSYGWMDEENNQHFELYDGPGGEDVTITIPDLKPNANKGEEDVVLVVPFGAALTITETVQEGYATSYTVDGGAETTGNEVTVTANKAPDPLQVVFTNRPVGTVTIAGTKTWIDGGKEHDNAADVALTLTRTSGKEGSEEETVADVTPVWDGANYTYADLPRYDEEGYEYTYDMNEAQVKGYGKPEKDASKENVFHFTNRIQPTPTPVRNPYYFSITKVWKGQPGGKISYTVYNPDGTVKEHTLKDRQISDTEWIYEGWFSREMDYYVIENAMEGYTTIYENKGDHAEVKDRVYNDGTIINVSVPKTGDTENPWLWFAVALVSLGLVCGVVLFGRQKKRK